MSEKTLLQSRKYHSIEENKIKSVSLFLATPEDVKEWSHGEVTKPETINYKTFKPEKRGLFDEVIFGPTIDFKCPICGTKYKKSSENQLCEKTDECRLLQPEILPKISRRTRMGHIELASPVVHFWFFKIDHSIISKLLGLRVDDSSKSHSKSELENIIYFKSHIVVESGDLKSLVKNEIIDINKAALIYHRTFEEMLKKQEPGSAAHEDIFVAIKDLEESVASKIGQDYGIDFYELNSIIETYSEAKIMTGAKAIEYLLTNVDLKNEMRKVKLQITKINNELKSNNKHLTKIQTRSKLYKRLDVIKSFVNSGQDPKNLLIYNLPIVPADLRPLVQIDGGRHSTTDVNELYRRIIIRNNRLKKWFELDAPILIVQNELRMLQEAVDALIDNSRKKPMPVMSKDNRPLKSIADSLTGKKGRFRQNLLGKRVDYSGRSVIVIGPELKMHQAGIPRQMVTKLFEPWIIKELTKADVVSSIKAAKKMIEEENSQIWPFVEKAIKGKVVLLNRAPTLHRLSIQAFEPVLVRGKAIRLHALVTTAFNADFDGDQMAVHVPISDKAIREAKELMMANKNILGPKDGEPIINPSQDMVLGIYYLSMEQKNQKGEGSYFGSYDEMIKSHDLGHVGLHAKVVIPASRIGKEYLLGSEDYIVSTVGKFIFNKAFPSNFPFIFDNTNETLKHSYKKHFFKKGTNLKNVIATSTPNEPFIKSNIAKVARLVFDLYSPEFSKQQIAQIIDKVNSANYQDITMEFPNLQNTEKQPVSKVHYQILSKIIKTKFEALNKEITIANEGVERVFETNEKIKLLEQVWFEYTNIIANAMDNIKSLGFKYSTISGATISISDIEVSKVKKEKLASGDQCVSELKKMYEKGLITDDERYQLSIKKWGEVKEEIQTELQKELKDPQKATNPIFMMMNSGARGNISNFVQLAGMRGLMANNKKVNKAMAKNNIVVRSIVDVPVKSSFLDGLSTFEFYSSTHGARKGLTDMALNTANSGYLTRRLVDMSQNIVVREKDCGSDNGFVVKNIVDTKTGVTIVPLEERVEGRFTNSAVVDDKGNTVLPADKLITPEDVQKVKKAKINNVEIKSVLGCLTKNGVCKKCYGNDLATNKIVQIGEAVGIIAAQSIGEPGTQLTMRTFHTGGVAGVEDITGGFDRLKQLIDATKQLWDRPAIISKTNGKIIGIQNEKNAKGQQTNRKIISVQANDKSEKVYEYPYVKTRSLRVKKNQEVKLGQKLVDGPILLDELLDVAGIRPVQNYLLKEIQRLYRMQGISISDKYIEIIIRQMLSKILIQDAGDSNFYVGALVDFHDYRETNGLLLSKGKKPAYGQIVIRGAKQIPLLSNSFLAAASYQETAKVLVHAAISGQKDNLEGLKENIILGHKIPAGTSGDVQKEEKYDIQNPRSYFQNKSLPR